MHRDGVALYAQRCSGNEQRRARRAGLTGVPRRDASATFQIKTRGSNRISRSEATTRNSCRERADIPQRRRTCLTRCNGPRSVRNKPSPESRTAREKGAPRRSMPHGERTTNVMRTQWRSPSPELLVRSAKYGDSARTSRTAPHYVYSRASIARIL